MARFFGIDFVFRQVFTSRGSFQKHLSVRKRQSSPEPINLRVVVLAVVVVIKNNKKNQKQLRSTQVGKQNHETMELLLLNIKVINFLKYTFSIETYAGR